MSVSFHTQSASHGDQVTKLATLSDAAPGITRSVPPPREGCPRGEPGSRSLVMRSVPGAIATGFRDRHHTSCDPVAIAPGTDSVAGQTNIAATAHRDVGTMDLRDGHLSAYLQSPRL